MHFFIHRPVLFPGIKTSILQRKGRLYVRIRFCLGQDHQLPGRKAHTRDRILHICGDCQMVDSARNEGISRKIDRIFFGIDKLNKKGSLNANFRLPFLFIAFAFFASFSNL